MIIFTARVIKIFFLAAAIFIGWKQFHKRLTKRTLFGAGMLIVLFAIMANLVSGSIPPLRDQVTLTAQGEKCDAANSSEIYLAGYTIDGNTFVSGESLVIEKGRWFWSGETYAWRPETDTRQPEGVTRTIVLEIPVGWSRTLNFDGNPWRGIVEVNNGTEVWTVDTYSESDSVISTEVGRSNTLVLLCNQSIRLLVYVLVLAAEAVLAALVILKREQVSQWRKRHPGILTIALIALLQLLIALHYSGNDCFWLDELYEIAWVENADSLWDHCFNSGAAAPLPIWAAIFHVWYKIVPYGEKWLLLLPEIATAAGIFFVGMCAREYSGPRAGKFAALFGMLSGIILVQCSYEIRSYGLYFASSALLLYLYLRSWRAPGYKVNIPLMCVVMTFFAGMHYHAVLYCVALFLIDCYAYFKHKVKTRSIIPYLVAAASYIPNLLCQKMIGVASSWQPVPNFSEVKTLILYLNNNSQLVTMLFLFGSSLLICEWVFKRRGRRKADVESLIVPVIPLFLIVFVVAVFVIYGKYINPKVTLWDNRYFCDLFPCTFVIAGFAIETLCVWIEQLSTEGAMRRKVVSLFLLILLIPTSLSTVAEVGIGVREAWRQAADWIYTQSNYIFNFDTVIVTTEDQQTISGWREYYIERGGRRDGLPVLCTWEVSKEQLEKYDRIYVVELHSVYANMQELLQNYEIVEKPGYGITVYSRKEAD